MYVDIHGIISSENKTTAVKESGNSPSPAQVVEAPTQRTNPHRWGYYTLFAFVLQGEFSGGIAVTV
jgi:hypothetical protein